MPLVERQAVVRQRCGPDGLTGQDEPRPGRPSPRPSTRPAPACWTPRRPAGSWTVTAGPTWCRVATRRPRSTTALLLRQKPIVRPARSSRPRPRPDPEPALVASTWSLPPGLPARSREQRRRWTAGRPDRWRVARSRAARQDHLSHPGPAYHANRDQWWSDRRQTESHRTARRPSAWTAAGP